MFSLVTDPANANEYNKIAIDEFVAEEKVQCLSVKPLNFTNPIISSGDFKPSDQSYFYPSDEASQVFDYQYSETMDKACHAECGQDTLFPLLQFRKDAARLDCHKKCFNPGWKWIQDYFYPHKWLTKTWCKNYDKYVTDEFSVSGLSPVSSTPDALCDKCPGEDCPEDCIPYIQQRKFYKDCVWDKAYYLMNAYTHQPVEDDPRTQNKHSSYKDEEFHHFSQYTLRDKGWISPQYEHEFCRVGSSETLQTRETMVGSNGTGLISGWIDQMENADQDNSTMHPLEDALLILGDKRKDDGVFIFHQPILKSNLFYADENAFTYGEYAKQVVDHNQTLPYDVYGYNKIIADKWNVFDLDNGENMVNESDPLADFKRIYDISKADALVNDAIEYRNEPISYKGRWNKDMAVYNPSIPFFDMASRLDEFHNQKELHPPFYRQETDKHVLAYNKYNSFPLFENRYGDGSYDSASYRSGPFEKYKDARVPGVEVTNEYIHLLSEPIDLTNKTEVDLKCKPNQVLQDMQNTINNISVYYKPIGK